MPVFRVSSSTYLISSRIGDDPCEHGMMLSRKSLLAWGEEFRKS